MATGTRWPGSLQRMVRPQFFHARIALRTVAATHPKPSPITAHCTKAKITNPPPFKGSFSASVPMYAIDAGRCTNAQSIPSEVSKLEVKREEIPLNNVAMSENPAAIKRISIRLLMACEAA
jgi:hypothetical protein